MKVLFEIGNRVELTHIRSASDRKLSAKKYGSQVLDFDGIRTVRLSMPIYENKVVPLEVEDDYNLCFFTNAGLYQCKGRIRKRYLDGKMSVMEVLMLTELKKYQRRKFFRLECVFSLKYRILSDVEKLLGDRLAVGKFETEAEREQCEQMLANIPKEWEEGTISDLSGGGMRFHCGKELKKGQYAEVQFPLSRQGETVTLHFQMEVIACVHYAESRVSYEVRGEFINVPDMERETVIKYVFEEQRRRMRKE